MFAFAVFLGIRETTEDFLVHSRRASGLFVTFSIVSTWVGVGVFAGTASAGYDSGISFGLTGAVGAAVAVLAAGLFAPRIKRFGDRFQAHTLADFFRIRYSPAVGRLASAVVILVYITFTAVQFTGLSMIVRVWTGEAFEIVMLTTAISTVVYTAFAGIKSDFYTDAIHFLVMVGAFFFVLLPKLLRDTGNLSALSELPASYFDPFSYGGPAYFFGGIIIGLGIVFVSMELWQRIYASTSTSTARWSLVSSAFIVIPFYALAAAIGMYAKLLYPDLADRDLALFVYIREHLGVGLLGLTVAALIATFVSSVNTMIMVVAASVTKDFLRPDPDANPRGTLKTARTTTLVAGAAGLILSYVVADIVTLSVVALYLLLVMLPAALGGFFWHRSTARAALWSIVAGLIAMGAAIPFIPESAFAPGFLMSLLVFTVATNVTDHSPTETDVSPEAL